MLSSDSYTMLVSEPAIVGDVIIVDPEPHFISTRADPELTGKVDTML
jgi:hypothetical protein